MGSTWEMRGSARRAAARCSAFRRRDSGVGGKFVGLRSLNAALEDSGEPGAGPFKVGSGGESTAEEETIAIKCLDGGGTLSMVGMLVRRCESTEKLLSMVRSFLPSSRRRRARCLSLLAHSLVFDPRLYCLDTVVGAQRDPALAYFAEDTLRIEFAHVWVVGEHVAALVSHSGTLPERKKLTA